MKPAPESRLHPLEPAHLALLTALGQAVRSRRLRAGWTVRELAERAGLSERFVSLMESGQGNPALTRLHDVARALGCAMTDLLPHAESTGVRPAVALLGLRGAGKTSVGKALARRLRVPFVEVDAEVEAEAGMKLGEIFAMHGEAYYRRMEVAALRRLLAGGRACVLATGGGVVTNAEAVALLRLHASTVWLRAPAALHWERVVAQGDRRPMAGKPQARAELESIYAQRAPLYAQADLTVDTAASAGPAAVAEELAERLVR